jgi:hypothetical protein
MGLRGLWECLFTELETINEATALQLASNLALTQTQVS